MQSVGISNYKINITGSITSNSYTKNADIDVHFNSGSESKMSDENADALNKRLRKAFQTLKSFDNDLCTVGTHPFEVYWQNNVFQDMMSIGCYDLFDDFWEVGPELLNTDFNPYAEYYNEIQQKSNDLAN